jgi:hypothetical protein
MRRVALGNFGLHGLASGLQQTQELLQEDDQQVHCRVTFNRRAGPTRSDLNVL